MGRGILSTGVAVMGNFWPNLRRWWSIGVQRWGKGWLVTLAGLAAIGGTGAGLWSWHLGTPPDPDQKLVMWLGDEPAPLDPGSTGDQWAMDLLGAVEEGLMRQGQGGTLDPGLAERVEVSPDHTRFVFHLRRAAWSDGVPLRAEDFRYAWLRVLDPATHSPWARLLYPVQGAKAYAEGKGGADQVAVKTLDDRTLEVKTTRPTPYFPSLTAEPALYPVRKDVVEKYRKEFGTGPGKMVFIGPFRMSSWDRDRQVTLAKNPTYWDARHVHLTSVTFKIVKELGQRISLYETGGLDQTGVAGSWLDRWKGKPDPVAVPEDSVFFLVFNPERYQAFANKNIRLALSYALDRRDYVRRLWSGAAEPAYGLVPPSIPGRTKSFRQENGDLFVDNRPDAARALLRNGLQELHLNALPPLTFLSDNSAPSVAAAKWLRDQWKTKLGIDVRIDEVPAAERLHRQRTGDYQVAVAGWGADYNDASAFLKLWVSDSPDNLVHYHNPDYDRLIAAAEASTDPAGRAEELEQAERILFQDMPVAPLFFRERVWLQKPFVKHIVYPPVGLDWDLKQAYVEKRP